MVIHYSAAIDQLTGKQANPEEGVQVHVWSQGLWIMLTRFGSLIPIKATHSHREKWKDPHLKYSLEVAYTWECG